MTINRINSNPIGGITVALPDSDGVVRGTVAATDFDGDDLTFTLANGASSGHSANGGIVLLNTDGTFTFIPKPAGLLGGLTLAARAEDSYMAVSGALFAAFGVLLGFRLVSRTLP